MDACKYCNRDFTNYGRSSQERHVKKCKKYQSFVTKDSTDHFVCNLCPTRPQFATQGNAYVHVERMHEPLNSSTINSKENCGDCNTPISRKSMKVHQIACQKYRGIIDGNSCLICKKDFLSRKQVMDHVGRLHKAQRDLNSAEAKGNFEYFLFRDLFLCILYFLRNNFEKIVGYFLTSFLITFNLLFLSSDLTFLKAEFFSC